MIAARRVRHFGRDRNVAPRVKKLRPAKASIFSVNKTG
jgi:hypothetical protein